MPTISDFMEKNFKHFNARESLAAARAWRELLDRGGQMFLSMAGAMSTGELGISLAEMIREDKVHGICCTAANLEEGLRSLADFTAQRNCTILLESLSPDQTDVINSMAEAAESIGRIGHPGIQGIFDFHNCANETDSWEQLIEDHFPIIRHVHLNEVNGSYPGTGSSDFVPTFRKLAQKGYGGWISLEIFHLPEDPAKVLRETRAFLDRMEDTLG